MPAVFADGAEFRLFLVLSLGVLGRKMVLGKCQC